MAKFKVLSQTDTQRECTGATSTFCLRVIEIEGPISPGLAFFAYSTHHPFEVLVRTVEKNESGISLRCETTWPVYEEMFDLAVIDSKGIARKDRFFYDHDNRYGTNAL